MSSIKLRVPVQDNVEQGVRVVRPFARSVGTLLNELAQASPEAAHTVHRLNLIRSGRAS